MTGHSAISVNTAKSRQWPWRNIRSSETLSTNTHTPTQKHKHSHTYSHAHGLCLTKHNLHTLHARAHSRTHTHTLSHTNTHSLSMSRESALEPDAQRDARRWETLQTFRDRISTHLQFADLLWFQPLCTALRLDLKNSVHNFYKPVVSPNQGEESRLDILRSELVVLSSVSGNAHHRPALFQRLG